MKEPSGFSRLSRTFERAVQQLALHFDRERKREIRGGEGERERDCFRKRNTSGTPRAGEREGGKNRDANLPSRRCDGGNYVLMRSRLAKSPGKRDTRPDLRTRNGVPSLSFPPPLIFQPPVTYGARVFVRVRLCTRTRAA